MRCSFLNSIIIANLAYSTTSTIRDYLSPDIIIDSFDPACFVETSMDRLRNWPLILPTTESSIETIILFPSCTCLFALYLLEKCCAQLAHTQLIAAFLSCT